jgi:WD40 repeat protein
MFVLGKHRGGLNTGGLAFSPQGRFLASGKNVVKVWDLVERREVREIATGDASSVTFAPDGSLVVTGRPAARFFDPETGKLIREVSCTWCKSQCALFSPDGDTLICGGHAHAGGGWVGSVQRFNLKTGRKRRPLLGPNEDVGFAAVSPDGRRVAAGGNQGTAWVWDTGTREILTTFTGTLSGWRVVAFSPDGRTLAITSERTIELWDPLTLQQQRVLHGHRATVWGVAFTPDGRLLSGGGDGTVRLWNPALEKARACLNWKIGAVNNVAAAPDGLTAAAASVKGDIVIWDLEAA